MGTPDEEETAEVIQQFRRTFVRAFSMLLSLKIPPAHEFTASNLNLESLHSIFLF